MEHGFPHSGRGNGVSRDTECGIGEQVFTYPQPLWAGSSIRDTSSPRILALRMAYARRVGKSV